MTIAIRHTLFQWMGIILVLTGSPVSSFGASSPKHKAATYFENQQYKEALEIWTEMVKGGHSGAALYHNIGLAESKLGHTVESIMAFEKALRFSPGNKSIQQALLLERKKIENSTIPIPEFFISRWYKGFLAWMRPGMWGFLGLVFIGGIAVDLVYQSFTVHRKLIADSRLRYILLIAGLLCFLFAVLRFQKIYAKGEAITTVSCEIHQAPDTQSPIKRTLHAGEKVEVLDRIGEWNRVSLLNLDEGWIRQDCLTPILL